MTGVIIEIKDTKSILLKNDGSFVEMKTQNNWQLGDVITVKEETKYPRFQILAAGILLFLIIGIGGYSVYYTEASIISIDINPSIELRLNSFDRVISTVSYNQEGAELLEYINLTNMKYDDAVKLLVNSEEIVQLIKDSPYFIFTVQTKGNDKETYLLDTIKESSYQSICHHNQQVQVEYATVDKEFVTQAHSHGVTSGKYMVLQELKDEIPEVDINDYCHSSINEIKEEIQHHHESSNCNHKHHHD